MLTVADIRKAIEGLPDDALVTLVIHADYVPESGPLVMLAGFGQDEGRATVYVDLMGMDDEDEDDDFDMDDDEDD
jgi:hypothetical protein